MKEGVQRVGVVVVLGGLGLRGDPPQPLVGVGLVAGKVEKEEGVAVGHLLSFPGPVQADRHLDPHRVERQALGLQPVADAAGDRGEQQVVDRHMQAEPLAGPCSASTSSLERPGDEGDLAPGGDVLVECRGAGDRGRARGAARRAARPAAAPSRRARAGWARVRPAPATAAPAAEARSASAPPQQAWLAPAIAREARAGPGPPPAALSVVPEQLRPELQAGHAVGHRVVDAPDDRRAAVLEGADRGPCARAGACGRAAPAIQLGDGVAQRLAGPRGGGGDVGGDVEVGVVDPDRRRQPQRCSGDLAAGPAAPSRAAPRRGGAAR